MVERPSDRLWLEFGQWLRSKRELARLKQDEAASRAGIDRQQWYRIETGRSGSRRDTVIALAKAVDADVAEALTRAGFAATEPPSPVSDIAERVKGLSAGLTEEEQIEMVEEVTSIIEYAKAKILAKREKAE